MLPSVAAGVREKRERNKTIGNILLQVWRKKEYHLVLLADKNLIVFNNFLFLLNFKSLFKILKNTRIQLFNTSYQREDHFSCLSCRQMVMTRSVSGIY